MIPTESEINAKSLYDSMRKHGSTAKGLLTPNKQTHQRRLDAAALLARYCVDRWRKGRVLDIGCGYGDMIPRLGQITADYDYTGIDMTTWILDVARNNFGDKANVRFREEKMEELDDRHAADLVLMLGILATVNDEELESTLKLASSLSRKALIASWTAKDKSYTGTLKAHRIEQLNEFLGPHCMIIGFGPKEPHKIALWLKT